MMTDQTPDLEAEYRAAMDRLMQARIAVREARQEFALADAECKRLERELGI